MLQRLPVSTLGQTLVETDCYPQSRRPPGGPVVESFTKTTTHISCEWVVPYNPYLLRKYESHCNVQVACSIQSLKYIYKYIYKGIARCEAALQENNGELQLNEIQSYFDARYLCPPEACASLFGYEQN